VLNTQLQHLIAKVAFLMTYVYNDYFFKVVFLCHSIKYTDFKPVNDEIILIEKNICCKSCPRSVYIDTHTHTHTHTHTGKYEASE
jgi:hypothetical protein